MAVLQADRTLAELVREVPARAAVLEKYQLDYCCGGDRTLEEACRHRCVAPETVLDSLGSDLPRNVGNGCDRDFWTAPIGELLDHLVDHHHRILREELPRIDSRMEKVLVAHAQTFPWLWKFAQVYRAMATELLSHLNKEERVLFPLARQLETELTRAPTQDLSTPASRSWPSRPREALLPPIHQMEAEHDFVGESLRELRRLSSDYALPDQACATWQVLWHSLQDLERDLHLHIHEENNVLHRRLRGE